MSWFESKIEEAQAEKLSTVSETSKANFSLEQIAPGETIHIWNEGKLHLHQVLEAALQHTGRADAHLCSWSISVPAMKSILRLHTSGLIASIAGVVDFRTRKDHPEAFDMARTLFRSLRVHPCHAKVIVLIGEKMNVSILGSANLTNNPKQERILVSADENVVQWDLKHIHEMLEKGEEVG